MGQRYTVVQTRGHAGILGVPGNVPAEEAIERARASCVENIETYARYLQLIDNQEVVVVNPYGTIVYGRFDPRSNA